MTQKPTPLGPSASELDAGDFVNKRAAKFPLSVVGSTPDAMLALITAAIPTYRLPGMGAGMGALAAGNAALQPYTQDQLVNAFKVLQQMTANSATAQTAPDELKSVIAYLDNLQRGGIKYTFTGVPASQDPLTLVPLILHVERGKSVVSVDLAPKITLDSSVAKMLARGKALNEGGYESLVASERAEAEKGTISAEAIASMEAADFAAQQRESLAQIQERREDVLADAVKRGLPTEQEVWYDYARAASLLSTIQQLYPEAQIQFRDKGALGGTIAGINEITNFYSIPSNFVGRNIAALGEKALGGLGLAKHKASFGNPADVIRESLSSPNIAFGEQVATGMGIKPTEKAWGPVTGIFNAVWTWKYDPFIIAGKAGAAAKLAHTVGLTEEAATAGRLGIPSAGGLHGDVGALYGKMGTTWQEFAVSETGTDFLRHVVELNKRLTDSAVVLHDYYGLDSGVAKSLSGAENVWEARTLLLDQAEGMALRPGIRGSLTTEKALLEDQLQYLRSVGRADSVAYAETVTRQRQVTKRLLAAENPQSVEVIRNFPRKSLWGAIKGQVVEDLAAGRISKKAAAFLDTFADWGIPGTRVRLGRLWESIPKGEWRNPHGMLARFGELELGVQGADAVMRDWGVSAARRKEVLGKIINSDGPDAWYRAVTEELGGALNEVRGAKKIAPRPLTSVPEFFSNKGDPIFGITPYTDDLGLASFRPTVFVLADTADGPIPRGRPSGILDFKQFLMPPSHDLAVEATGLFRRLINKTGWGKYWSNSETAVRGLQGLEDAITGFWKDGILLGRGPAVLTRTELEQFARIQAFAAASAMNQPFAWIRYLFKSGMDEQLLKEISRTEELTKVGRLAAEDTRDRMLGLISNQMGVSARTQSVRRVLTWAGADAETRQAFVNAIRRSLEDYFNEPFSAWKQLAKKGPEDFVKWVKETPEGESWFRHMKEVIAEEYHPADVDPLLFHAQQKFKEIQNVIRDNPLFSRAIKHGHVYDEEIVSKLNEVEELRSWAAEVRADAEASIAEGQLTTGQELMQQAHLIDRNIKQLLREAGVPEKRLRRLAPPGGPAEGLEAEKKLARFDLSSEEFNKLIERMIERGDYEPPAYIAGFREEPMAGVPARRKLRNWLYRYTLSKPDSWLSRRPLWRRLYDTRLGELRAVGIPEAAAKRQASFWAADQTRELLYDLSERTSAQHFFRHIAPFMPAWQEIMTTWMWKLPSKMYPVLGHAYFAERMRLIVEGLQQFGFDPSKPGAIPVLGPLVEWWMNLGYGGPALLATGKLKDMNIVSQTYYPGLGPIPATALAGFSKKFNGFIDTIAEAALPYGVDVQFGPASVSRAWEGIATYLGAKNTTFPLDIASGDYKDIQHGFAMADAIRATYYEFNKKGLKAPDPKDFPSDEAFDEANDAWADDLLDAARKKVASIYLKRALLAAVQPIPIYISDKYSRDVPLFYDQLSQLMGRSGQARELWQQWVDEHPNGELYLTPSSIKRGALAQDASDGVFSAILDEQREQLDPRTFLNFGLGLTSQRLWEKRYTDSLKELVGKTEGQPLTEADAAALLFKWGERGQALAQKLDERDRYLRYNDDFARIWEKMLQAPDKLPPETLLAERIADFQSLAKIFANDKLITDALPGIDFKSIASQFGRILVGAYGEPKDPVGKALAWYFENVMNPTFAKIDEIKKGLDKAKTKADQGEIFDQIRKVFNSQAQVTGPGGVRYPTVEEFLWGNKDPDSQQELRTKWITRRPEWLTGFQRGIAGFSGGPNVDQLYDYVNDIERRFRDKVKRERISSSSGEYDALVQQRDNLISQRAQKLGVPRTFVNLIHVAPYERLRLVGEYSSVPFMYQIFRQADRIAKSLKDLDLSPKGHSAKADEWKEALYRAIDRSRLANQDLDDAWNELQAALGKEFPAVAHPVYAAILFNDFFGL